MIVEIVEIVMIVTIVEAVGFAFVDETRPNSRARTRVRARVG